MTGRLKRTLRVVLLTGTLSAVATGGLAVLQARSDYYGVCSSLSGFPGLLQEAGLLQSGNCSKPVPGGVLCNAGSSCTVSGQAGKCKNKAQPGGAALCACVATPTPNSLF